MACCDIAAATHGAAHRGGCPGAIPELERLAARVAELEADVERRKRSARRMFDAAVEHVGDRDDVIVQMAAEIERLTMDRDQHKKSAAFVCGELMCPFCKEAFPWVLGKCPKGCWEPR